MRYIVDLNGYGKEFMNQIRTLSLGYVNNDPGGQIEREKYIYNDSANQIFMIMDANMPKFMLDLQQLPRMEYFQHIPDLHHPHRKQMFTEQLRVFAIGLVSQVSMKLGLRFEMDYLLETITDDYMIVNVIEKSKTVIHEDL